MPTASDIKKIQRITARISELYESLVEPMQELYNLALSGEQLGTELLDKLERDQESKRILSCIAFSTGLSGIGEAFLDFPRVFEDFRSKLETEKAYTEVVHTPVPTQERNHNFDTHLLKSLQFK